MGTLAALAPILGLFAGTITARLAKSEARQGQKYFILLQNTIFSVIIAIITLNFGITWAILSAILAFIILWKFSCQLYLMPLLAIAAAKIPATQIPIFLYCIPTGTLSKDIKKTLFAAIAYFIIAVLAS